MFFFAVDLVIGKYIQQLEYSSSINITGMVYKRLFKISHDTFSLYMTL